MTRETRDKLRAAALEWAEETLTAFAEALQNVDDERALTSTLELALADFEDRLEAATAGDA